MADNTNFSFHIKNKVIRDKKYFVYHNKKHPVDFDLLKKNSNYFYRNKKQFKKEECIELIDKKEEYVKLTDESIEAFISSIQNDPCSIKKASIIPLQYLAHKYEFNELIQITDKFIEDHSEDLVFEILFFKIAEMEGKENNDSFFDTSKEELIISEHLSEFLQKEEMLLLPIQIIYRILALFYKHQKNDEISDDVTNFLFKCLDKYGRPASALFNIIDFGEQRIEVVNRLIENYSDKFDFNLINKTLTKTVKELTSEVTKQKEEYSKLFKQMQETFKEQLSELREMKKQEEEKQKQNEIENQKRINDFHLDVEKIKNDFEKKVNFQQDQFKQICTKQEELMDSFVVKKYHQIILQTITFGQFLKFDDKLKDHYLSELFKNEFKQSNQKDLLRAKIILYLYTIPESYDYFQIVQFLTKNANDQATFKIMKDKIEDLYQKGQLNSFLISCIDVSKDILVEIDYPCNKYEQIMKILSDIKSQNQQKMKISITINVKSYFEQKYECNKIIDTCKVGKSIDVIPEKAFCQFSSLSVLELSPDTVTIESSSFQNCSSLKEIVIPTSVKSIPDHCFDCCSKLDRMTINPFYTQIQFNTFDKCPSLKNFSVSTARDSKYKTCEHILIPYNMTDTLYQTNFLNSSELASYISECTEIAFEIQYPSSNFSNIYQKVINLEQNNSEKVKIGIFYTQMETADKHFARNEDINYVRLDSNIKRTPNDGDDKSDGSFEECSSLIEAFIPSSLTKIGNSTFYNCYSLKKINFEFPSSVTSIGIWTFYLCNSLIEISIPSSVTFIGNNAFNLCSNLARISFSIPSSLTSIEESAFYECSSLTQISIPSSVTFIGNNAFNLCSNLARISFSNPSSLTSIEENAFYKCSSLTQISIPSSVTSIGKDAFYGCSSLIQITIPSAINTNNLGISSNVTIIQI